MPEEAPTRGRRATSPRSPGRLAKTDQIEATVLALLAERVRPDPGQLPAEDVQALDAVVTRRRQLVGMLTAEQEPLELGAATGEEGDHQTYSLAPAATQGR